MRNKRPPEVNVLFKLLKKVLKDNRFSPNKYAVFGSGPMGIRGLHVINDVDVIVTKDQFEAIAARHGWEPHEHGIRRIMLYGDKIEILDGWHPMIAPLDELIAKAEIINGLRFVRLDRVLEWKMKRRKPKDTEHIRKICAYMRHKGDPCACKRLEQALHKEKAPQVATEPT